MTNRFSSRRQRLSGSFLNDRLAGAKSYDRIAGYFSSSVLEVAGEQIESVAGTVRVVCNSELEPGDIVSARRAVAAQQQSWRKSLPEQKAEHAAERFRRLHDLLVSGKLEVKVLPEHAFGLIHGKAGVIHMADGQRTAFMGSANDTFRAWNVNYELVWEDDSAEAVQWVQEEFDALWQSPAAFPLA
jgi:phosphatidylserine/phosphatidylglycerophosphate/cardiolipin synthase-like enzyme